MALISTGSILPPRTKVFPLPPFSLGSVSVADTDLVDGIAADTTNLVNLLGGMKTAFVGKYMITATLPSSYCMSLIIPVDIGATDTKQGTSRSLTLRA